MNALIRFLESRLKPPPPQMIWQATVEIDGILGIMARFDVENTEKGFEMLRKIQDLGNPGEYFQLDEPARGRRNYEFRMYSKSRYNILVISRGSHHIPPGIEFWNILNQYGCKD